MPLNPQAKLVENIFKRAKRTQMSAQDIQDEIFRHMSVEKKLKLTSDFFKFAHSLNPRAFHYGTGRVTQKNSRHSR